MIKRVQEKRRAIELRKKGYSYNEILKEVNVAKSSLSLWLKDLPLTDDEKKYLKTRKDSNISRGRIKAATANRNNRLRREETIFEEAKSDFERCASEPLFQVGVALYWAEGAKRNTFFAFSNSDHEMIELMLKWIELYTKYERTEAKARLFIHKPYAHEKCEQFWSEKVDIPIEMFDKTIYKPSGLLVKKRPHYKGCLRISLPKSSKLLKKMILWHHMLARHYSN